MSCAQQPYQASVSTCSCRPVNPKGAAACEANIQAGHMLRSTYVLHFNLMLLLVILCFVTTSIHTCGIKYVNML